jgi:CheY-like chemotaxis protein
MDGRAALADIGPIVCARPTQANSPPLLLIVDDDPDQLWFVAHAATKAGSFQICTAENGTAALEALHGRAAGGEPLPDLILTDLKMPDLDGVEFARSVNQRPELRHVPIVILTSSACLRGHNLDTGAGIAAFVQKPAAFDELVELMRMLPAHLGTGANSAPAPDCAPDSPRS